MIASARVAAGVLLAFWIALVPALSAAATPASGPPARPPLPETLLAHLAEIEELQGTFRQTRHIAVLAIPLHSTGTFHYQREQGIVWRTEDPIRSEIRITPNQGVVAIDELGGSRALPASDVVAGIFLSLFAGELDQLREYFAVEAVPADTLPRDSAEPAMGRESGHPSWALRLTPKLPALAGQIEYVLVAGAEHVDSVAIQDANGDRSELTLALAQPGEPAQP